MSLGLVQPHAPRPGAVRRADQRRRRASASVLVVTLASAAALGMVLYVVSTSLPFLASSPTADPHFGAQSQCLIGALPTPRVGYAVSWNGDEVAGFSGGALAVCARDGGARIYPVKGVQQAAWDERGTLWLGTSEIPDAGWRLWYLDADAGPVSAGDFAPVALAGHASGAVALDATGKLVSLARAGEVTGLAQLPAAPVGPFQLTANEDGTLATVVAGGGLFAFTVPELKTVRAEAPCDVEFLWWTRGDGAVLSCGPASSFALALHVRSGARDAAPRRNRARSVLVPGLGVYVQPCEQLPCTAPAP